MKENNRVLKLRWMIWPQIGLALFATMIAYFNLLPKAWLAWPYSDKVLHFFLYGLIAFWLRFWSPTSGSFWKRHLPVILLLTYIITEECFQSLSPYRTFDFQDMGCDLAGVLLFWGWGKRFSQHDSMK